jgi:acyl-coenzyme A thioesterase PaaI-like protein
MSDKAFQDFYSDAVSQCYGCGRLNPHGLQIKSRWDGAESVCRFTPRPYHTALPGIVYGGLVASLIDCHGTGTAAAAAYRAAGREMGTEPELRFVTASLHVDYLKPTPLGAEIEVRGTIEEQKERKVVVAVTLSARGEICAKGHVIAVLMPAALMAAVKG